MDPSCYHRRWLLEMMVMYSLVWLCICAHDGLSYMMGVEVIISLLGLHCWAFKVRCGVTYLLLRDYYHWW